MNSVHKRILEVQHDIEKTAEKYKRDAKEITCIVVTKTHPYSVISQLYESGVRDIGENRHQEALEKFSRSDKQDITWHMLGGIQSNKASRVASWADVVHSLDSEKVAVKLSNARKTDLDVFIQVNIEQDSDSQGRHGIGRHGIPVSKLNFLASRVAELPLLRLVGLMTVLPLREDPEKAMSRMYSVYCDFREKYPNSPFLSAGMSQDYKIAIKYGATHLRLGSAILGNR